MIPSELIQPIEETTVKLSLFRTGIAAAMLGMIGASAVCSTARAADLGALNTNARNETISVTVALKLSDLAGAESMMERLVTPGDSMYLKFLTPAQVEQQFGPNEADVARVIATLNASGLSAQRATSTTLTVTGKAATFETVFQTSLHQFAAPATAKTAASTFRAAVGTPVVPASIASVVRGVIGLNTNSVYHPHLVAAPSKLGGTPVSRIASGSSSSMATGNAPGFLTVQDFADLYDVNPLYARGVSGKGRTLAIVTLANFTPSDVFAYWKSLNLNVDPNRLKVVNIDGGPGAPSDDSGSIETSLDVEQSGGIAPGAKIIVYQAPNTNQGFLDAFARAVHDNKADTFSSSWGEWELFDNLATSPVTDEFFHETVSALQATHEVFVVAALQGQSGFVSSGDCGAYDAFDQEDPKFNPIPPFNPLSVDNPGSDSAITAAGGTTLPGLQQFNGPKGTIINITVPTERVWAWDYLEPLCNALDLDFITCGIFPTGSGGGVSVFFPIPVYQLGIFGTQTSQPNQTYTNPFSTPVVTKATLPAHFPGRNVPDISFNADPETGYVIFYTSDGTEFPAGFGVQTFFGGTSFVAPQLNGVTSLLGQNAGHRLGLLNFELYNLSRFGQTSGPHAPIHTISAGDNWFYDARNGYSPSVGLGTMDVFNMSRVMH
jgi:kumamolisin